jgi:hypothetical protein
MELSDWRDAVDAQARAAQLLAEHVSCAIVEVWDDAQLCLSLSRDASDGFAAAAG